MHPLKKDRYIQSLERQIIAFRKVFEGREMPESSKKILIKLNETLREARNLQITISV